ncbi:hypothetical protein [Haliangium sp.]|uniref:hypothetical protein n=1 Tax=Haliangium sp. TaxID=2663208 RepID=UPI003D0B602A
MRWLAIMGVLALGLVGTAGAARAQAADDELPAGRIGAGIGLRAGLGRLGSDFGLGLVGSIEAGYHPTSRGQRVSLGVSWAVRRGWFGYDDEASVAGSLHLTEFDFGGRMRIAITPSGRRFLTLGAGASLLRTNVPVPPDDERTYWGGYGTVGVEFFVLGYLMNSEIRYGPIGAGPASISFMAGVSLGT